MVAILTFALDLEMIGKDNVKWYALMFMDVHISVELLRNDFRRARFDAKLDGGQM